MDPTQLADEALKRFAALNAPRSQSSGAAGGDQRDCAAESLLAAFHHLAKLDGWAKIAMDRLVADPEDARATQELKLSMEQAARLHPQFTRRLADLLADRPPLASGITGRPLPQQASASGRAPSENRS
jgi:hypothetical protein